MENIHIQTWVDSSDAATIIQWFNNHGITLSSFNNLGQLVFSELASLIVASGGTPVLDDVEIATVLNSVTRRNTGRKPLSRVTTREYNEYNEPATTTHEDLLSIAKRIIDSET